MLIPELPAGTFLGKWTAFKQIKLCVQSVSLRVIFPKVWRWPHLKWGFTGLISHNKCESLWNESFFITSHSLLQEYLKARDLQ